MARWLVELSGDRHDLEALPKHFPDGDVFAVRESESYFLTGQRFEQLGSSEAVLAEALAAIDRFTAIVSLLNPSFRKPTANHVIHEKDDGIRDIFVQMAGSLEMRSQMGTVAIGGSIPGSLQPTQAQQVLARATQSVHLERALVLWSQPNRSWPRLYTILEEIEQHLGTTANSARLCLAKERDRFRRTANSAEVAGSEARHAIGKFKPSPNPMTLGDADAYIGRMLMAALQ